jgi:cell division septation protein DedD
MSKNTLFGLATLVAVIIVAGLLARSYFAGPPTVRTAPEATSKPLVAPAPITPEPKQPVQPAPPIQTEPPQGIPPLQEPPSPASKVRIPPPPEMKDYFGVLVDSYANYQDAAKMLGKLKKQGKTAFVQRDPKNSNLFQVWLGPFSSQSKAQAAAKDLKATLKKTLKVEQIENPVPK